MGQPVQNPKQARIWNLGFKAVLKRKQKIYKLLVITIVMEKEIGRIKKNDTTDIIVRVDEYKGKKGLTIREFITTDKYTGFTKAGVRIGPDDFLKFRELVNSIDYNDITSPAETQKTLEKPKKEKKAKKKEEEPKKENSEEVDES